MRKILHILIFIIISIPCFSLYAPGNAPFINSFLLLGVFDNSDFNKEYCNVLGEPYEGLEEQGKRWEYFDDRYFSRNYDDYVDLFSYYRYKSNENIDRKCAYLHVYVYSDRKQEAQIRGDGDSNFRVWFNGEVVLEDIDVVDTYKDKNIGNITLNNGYNSIMIKIGNESLSYLGFYLRICDSAGNEIPSLRYCLNKSEKVKIETKEFSNVGVHNLPFGYREWPYIEYRVPLYDKLSYEIINIKNDQLKIAPSASYFYFMAEGNCNIKWSVSRGKLPKGLTFESDGSIRGRIASSAKLGDYKFTLKASGDNNTYDTKDFILTVKERPNKWVDEGGLTSLIHIPETVTDEKQLNEIAFQMKRQNYTLAMPIAYGNGDYYFRWDSIFSKDENDYKYSDCMKQYKTALENNGIAFGMYIGNFSGVPQFDYNQGALVLEDAMKKLDPKAFWFDWAGIDRPQNDALYSAIKSYNPNVLIILNGMLGAFYNGDYDIMAQEGMNYGNINLLWSLWPTEYRYNNTPFIVDSPKIGGVECWKFMSNPNGKLVSSDDASLNVQDWRDMLKIEISLRGDGVIANIDHTTEIDSSVNKDVYESFVMRVHKKMADWANPMGLTPLWTSFTNTMPYKFNNVPGPQNLPWGYATINSHKDKIYLHFIENKRGKTGLPEDRYFSVNPVLGKVKDIVWMNTGLKVKYIQNKNEVVIDLENITQDQVDTVLCLDLENPIDYYPVYEPYPLNNYTPRKDVRVSLTSVKEGKAGDIAYNKPSKILNVIGDKELFASMFIRLPQNGNDNDMTTDTAASWFWDWSYWLDLEKSYVVKKIVLDFNENSGIAIDFDIVVSKDNENWETLLSYRDNDKAHFVWDVNKDFRYIKVIGLKPNGPGQGGQMAINNIEIYE
ncbi:MAG: putative Ig domain-containing protein [Abditibacteriota bacterium]|nr:putative Ig domain-containing protein [Abditibacteriota bacterium]